MIPPPVEERLRAHVDSVLGAAHVPRSQRPDLADELYGHLVERWRALVDDGLEPMAAADRAVADFGTAGRIGRDLTRTYRGRFWASTIGVLLPASAGAASQPRLVWWLAASLRIYGVLYVLLGAALALDLSPVRALLVVAIGLPAAALMFVGATALGRRQRWALDLAIVVNVIGLFSGLREMLATPGLISLNVVFSGILLLIGASERHQLGTWIQYSRPIRNGLAGAILLLVLGANFAPVVARELPDPTQASADDLHLKLTIDCKPRLVTLTADIRWDRTSLLPGGLAHVQQYGDLLLLDQSSEEAWQLDNYPVLVNATTGEVVAEPDEAFAPNQERTLHAIRGPYAIQIAWDALKPGETYRTTWVLRPWDNLLRPEILVLDVEYLHADRFRWEALADCDRGVFEEFVSGWLTKDGELALAAGRREWRRFVSAADAILRP